MKRKVQAQRKFAQGAYIPPNTNNTSVPVDRKSDQTPQKDAQDQVNQNIIRTVTSASHLLDVVCFQKLHKHVDPIVLLERLKYSPPVVQAEPLQRRTIAKPSLGVAKRLIRYLTSCKTFKKKYAMRLRSSGPIGNFNKEPPKPQEKPGSSRKSSTKSDRRIKNEDDRPLTYFTKRNKQGKPHPRKYESDPDVLQNNDNDLLIPSTSQPGPVEVYVSYGSIPNTSDPAPVTKSRRGRKKGQKRSRSTASSTDTSVYLPPRSYLSRKRSQSGATADDPVASTSTYNATKPGRPSRSAAAQAGHSSTSTPNLYSGSTSLPGADNPNDGVAGNFDPGKTVPKKRGRKKAQPVASNNAPPMGNNEMVIEGQQEIEEKCPQIRILNTCSVGPTTLAVLLTLNNEWEESIPQEMPAMPLPITTGIKEEQDLPETNDATPLPAQSSLTIEQVEGMPQQMDAAPLSSDIQQDEGMPEQMQAAPSQSSDIVDVGVTPGQMTAMPPQSSDIVDVGVTPGQMTAMPPQSSDIVDVGVTQGQMTAMPPQSSDIVDVGVTQGQMTAMPPQSSDIVDVGVTQGQMTAMPQTIPVLPAPNGNIANVPNAMVSIPSPQQIIAQPGPSGLQPVQLCAQGYGPMSVYPQANICAPGNYSLQYGPPQHFEPVQIPLTPEAQIRMAGNYAMQHMTPSGYIALSMPNLQGQSAIQYIQSANAQLYRTQDSYVAAYKVQAEHAGPSQLQPCTMAISASNYPDQRGPPQSYGVMPGQGGPSQPAITYPTQTNSYNPQEPEVMPASNYPAPHRSPEHNEEMSSQEPPESDQPQEGQEGPESPEGEQGPEGPGGPEGHVDNEEPGPSGIKFQPSRNSYNPQQIESEDTEDTVIDSDGEDAGPAWSTFSGSSTTVYDCDADEDETQASENESADVIMVDPPPRHHSLYTVNEIEKRINESVQQGPSVNPWGRSRPMNYERQTKMVKVRGKWKYRQVNMGANIVKPDVDSKSSLQVCPTKGFNLIEDVVNAPYHIIQGRCRKCKGCYLVKKVLCLTYLYVVRIAHDSFRQKECSTSAAVGDVSNGSNTLSGDQPPSQRSNNNENRNVTNTITSPNGETFEEYSAQTFYIDIVPHTNYLIELNWNWVPSTKSYIITAGVTAKSEDKEITQLNLTSHIHLLKEVLTFMSNYFKERQIEPFTFMSENLFFGKVNRETTMCDVVKRVVQVYEAFANQSTSENTPFTPASFRKFIQNSFSYRESPPRRKRLMPPPAQPFAARHALPSSAALSTRPTRARVPDTFRAPRQIRPRMPLANPSTSAEGNFLCHPRERPKQPPHLGGKHGCNKQPHMIANLKKDRRKAPAKTVKKKRWSCKNAKAVGRLAARHREGALPRDQVEEQVTAKHQKKAPPKLKLHSDVPVAPIYHPTEEEFKDPITYFKKIMPEAASYGLCKVVAPEGFKPKCTLNNDMRFSVTNQYICRLYNRWGPASREMCAIKSYLATQSVYFLRSPLLEGVEVNLPKLYQIVQRLGGLKQVIEKKRWTKIAEEMRLTRTPKADKKIDKIYVKYILPYDMLSHERMELMRVIETCWAARSKKMMDRAMNPLHRKKRLLGESDSSEDEEGSDSHVMDALAEAEDCFVNGRVMTLATFKKVGKKIIDTYFGRQKTPLDVIENSYWKLVLGGLDHLCVNTASIDTGEEGYGFPKNPRDPFGKHPWNLKVLSQNSGNVLRYLGPVLGVTVPTLHLGMLFSSSCWHRDPHGLPWIEYLHNGPSKVWYGIPESESANFRKVAEEECPTLCQNKLIWLPSDIAMIPPEVLVRHGVGLSRIVQQPGEFVLVLPRSYSCSVSTGYTESESVYFATDAWFASVHEVFHDLRESCEPTMFSLEKLLLAAAQDATVPLDQLCQVYQLLKNIIDEEIANRASLAALDVKCEYSQPHLRQRPSRTWNVREQEECEVCRSTLYLSRVRGLIEKSSVCPQHALLMFKARKVRCNYDSAEIEIFFKETELIDILKKVETRLATNECELATFCNQTMSIAAEA